MVVDDGVLFLFPGLGAVKVNVPSAPDRQIAEVEFFQGVHVGRFVVHVEVGDPFLVGGELVEDRGARFGLELVVVFPYEDVVVDSVVAVQDGHEAHDFRAVRDVVRRVALAELAFDHSVAAGVDRGDGAHDEVVNEGEAFRRHPEGNVGKQNVVVYERGAVADFHKDVLAAHAALQVLG